MTGDGWMDNQLDKFKNKLLNYFNGKIDEQNENIEVLSDDIMKMNIEIEETKKIITGLKNNMDDSQDIFSPSDNNDSFMLQEIKKLDDRVSEITDCMDKEKNEIAQGKDKIKEMNRMCSYKKKVKISKEEKQQRSEENIGDKKEIGKIEDIKDKVDFCRKICITDVNRCKLELDNIYEMLSDL